MSNGKLTARKPMRLRLIGQGATAIDCGFTHDESGRVRGLGRGLGSQPRNPEDEIRVRAEVEKAFALLREAATEHEQSRRAETEVRALENEYQRLVADTRVRVQEENQRKTVGVEQEHRNAAALVAGLKAEIEAEKQLIEMLGKKFEANLITPAQAERERYILGAQADVAEKVKTMV